jgi:hypothetical protein
MNSTGKKLSWKFHIKFPWSKNIFKSPLKRCQCQSFITQTKAGDKKRAFRIQLKNLRVGRKGLAANVNSFLNLNNFHEVFLWSFFIWIVKLKWLSGHSVSVCVSLSQAYLLESFKGVNTLQFRNKSHLMLRWALMHFAKNHTDESHCSCTRHTHSCHNFSRKYSHKASQKWVETKVQKPISIMIMNDVVSLQLKRRKINKCVAEMQSKWML